MIKKTSELEVSLNKEGFTEKFELMCMNADKRGSYTYFRLNVLTYGSESCSISSCSIGTSQLAKLGSVLSLQYH